jgi:hypothetical protein
MVWVIAVMGLATMKRMIRRENAGVKLTVDNEQLTMSRRAS